MTMKNKKKYEMEVWINAAARNQGYSLFYEYDTDDLQSIKLFTKGFYDSLVKDNRGCIEVIDVENNEVIYHISKDSKHKLEKTSLNLVDIGGYTVRSKK